MVTVQKTDFAHWSVEWVEPADAGKRWNRNKSTEVYAPTFDRAYEVFRSTYPEAVIIKILKVGVNSDPLIDPELR